MQPKHSTLLSLSACLSSFATSKLHLHTSLFEVSVASINPTRWEAILCHVVTRTHTEFLINVTWRLIGVYEHWRIYDSSNPCDYKPTKFSKMITPYWDVNWERKIWRESVLNWNNYIMKNEEINSSDNIGSVAIVTFTVSYEKWFLTHSIFIRHHH
jgi:hypothetical protein